MGDHMTETAELWKMQDGTDVLIRAIRPEDEPFMVKFHQALSEHSVYLRYFQMLPLPQRVAPDRLAQNCRTSACDVALVAERDIGETKEILAVGRLMKKLSHNQAEAAVIVRDQSQHQGLGAELLRRLLAIARDRSIARVVMYILRENIEIGDMAIRLGFQVKECDDPILVYCVRDYLPSSL